MLLNTIAVLKVDNGRQYSLLSMQSDIVSGINRKISVWKGFVKSQSKWEQSPKTEVQNPTFYHRYVKASCELEIFQNNFLSLMFFYLLASVCSQRVVWGNVRRGLDVVLQRRHSQDDERHDPRRPHPDWPPRRLLDRQHLLHWKRRRLSRGRSHQPGCQGDCHLEPYWQVLGARMTFILCSPVAALTWVLIATSHHVWVILLSRCSNSLIITFHNLSYHTGCFFLTIKVWKT